MGIFWIIVGVVVAVMLAFGLRYDRRRRRRGLSTGFVPGDGAGAHGAFAEGLHTSMQSGNH